MTGIVSLAHIQDAIRLGANEAAEQILLLLREWIIPRVQRLSETLREAYGAWFKAAFGDLLRDQLELRRELHRIIYIEEAAVVMNTFGNIIAAKEKEGEAQDLELGGVRSKKEILLQLVSEFWSDDETAQFARQLDSADRSQFPTIADPMRDQAAGRLSCLRQNGRTKSSK